MNTIKKILDIYAISIMFAYLLVITALHLVGMITGRKVLIDFNWCGEGWIEVVVLITAVIVASIRIDSWLKRFL